ncbi:MAG: indole-3-glycerol phosphate synthase TrpC [Nonlabens sp.]|nr:indole-3-glycerol phosphate synthase TrpC [Nonlabens sp.]
MDDILKKITDRTAKDLVDRKLKVPLATLREMPFYNRKTISFTNSLSTGSGIIAEHKRQSPSKGSFNCPASLKDVVTGYENAGASAISCLTDEPFFGGDLQDLLETRAAVNIPVLRKDFMIDLYQVHEAKAYGADLILLIAACLNDEELYTLSLEALNLGLEILFEVHDLEELERVKKVTEPFNPAKYAIGVNNRDLKRFKTDVANSVNLLPHFPAGVIAISESGLNDPETVKSLRNTGYTGFLIGEHFMKTNQPGAACASFIKAINS